METDRRRFLALAGTLAAALPMALALPGGLPVAHAANGEPLYATCCQLPGGDFAVALIDAGGRIHGQEKLAARGHSLAVDPTGAFVVAFARRPGTFALAIDAVTGRARHAFATPPERHFEGHGVFSPDGRLLYASENAYEDGSAVIGIYDAAAGFARVDELPGHGLGSHEILLSPDGSTLVVANGGILTHPDYPRANLDLAGMEPSVVWIDRRSGDLIARSDPPKALNQLSLRHMSTDGTGRAWIGCQWMGDRLDPVPLIATHKAGEEIAFVEVPEDVRVGLGQYIGSVTCNAAGTRMAVASPVGGTVVVFDVESRKIVERRVLADGCGAAQVPGDGFLLTSGKGDVILERGGRVVQASVSDIAWDNHIRRL